MKTSLDIYKVHYGMKNECDGAVVLKHADHDGFHDHILFKTISRKKLETIGINVTMSREQVVECLENKMNEEKNNKVTDIFFTRHTIIKLIDFCTYEIPGLKGLDNSNTEEVEREESKKPETSLRKAFDSRVLDPILDAIGRRIFTGSFSKKPKK